MLLDGSIKEHNVDGYVYINKNRVASSKELHLKS
jgi:hypothetical protein